MLLLFYGPLVLWLFIFIFFLVFLEIQFMLFAQFEQGVQQAGVLGLLRRLCFGYWLCCDLFGRLTRDILVLFDDDMQFEMSLGAGQDTVQPSLSL